MGYKGKREFYYTTSTKLADQFQHMCLHAGWASMLYTHIEKGQQVKIHGRDVENHHDVLKLSVIKNRINPCVNHGHTSTQNVQEESFGKGKVPVYCLTVPTGVFYVRRNGKAVWTGNSRSRGP